MFTCKIDIYMYFLDFSTDSDLTDGDLDELVDELNEGKMLYAAIKVMDPNTNLPKIVFINWVCHLYQQYYYFKL